MLYIFREVEDAMKQERVQGTLADKLAALYSGQVDDDIAVQLILDVFDAGYAVKFGGVMHSREEALSGGVLKPKQGVN
jgi:hypothetical protein